MSDLTSKISDLSPVKLALMARKLREGVEGIEYLNVEPLAVIGMGCRFPGPNRVVDLEKFWEMLNTGADAFKEVPLDKWDIDDYYDADRDAPGKMYTRKGAYMEELKGFDASFFGISPNEANSMDPQQRMAVEVAYEALENAGIKPADLNESRTGVYMGVGQIDYSDLELKAPDPTHINAYTGTGLLFSAVSGRISYLLGLQGPSVTIDGACASSLMTVHLACQALREGECNLAIAGGVHLVLTPNMTVYLSRSKALSPGGICKTFDESADGYARGEGCGMIVIKRLSDALKDGDNILALIRGSALNHGGPSQGFTVPNGVAQQKLIREALNVSGVAPEQISYIEAHGTGTKLGDPIEVNALNQVFRKGRDRENTLYIGSVKTNIGHLEAAAGVAGLIKTVLALQHKKIPKHLHYEKANPNMDLNAVPMAIPYEKTLDWNPPGGRRLAGVSSFGITGQNAHVILEEAPALPKKTVEVLPQRYLLPLSARSKESLLPLAADFADFIEKSEATPYDIARAAGQRGFHELRLAVAGETKEQLVEALRAAAAGESHPGLAAPRTALGKRKIAFVYSGQGQQWWAMGRRLLDQEKVFRAKIEEIDGLLKENGAAWSLLEELGRGEDDTRLGETEIAQPAIFALQTALTALLADRGVEPAGVTGHSVGDVAAAHAAGALDLPTAVRVIYHRARLMQEATGLGKMAAVDAPYEKIKHLVEQKAYAGRLELGALNSPISCVLSGEEAALNEVLAKIEGEKIRVKMLPVNYAFHSPQMEPFKDALARELSGLKAQRPTRHLYSTVTGKLAETADYDAAYWGRNIRQAVRFEPAVAAMAHDGYNVFVEISAHPVLAAYIGAICEKNEQPEAAVVSLLRRKTDDLTAFAAGLGGLFAAGHEIDFAKLYPVAGAAVALPTYHWDHKQYWVQESPASVAPGAVAGHIFWGRRLRSPLDAIQFESFFSAQTPYFLRDHVLYDEVVVPGASHMSLILSGARNAFGDRNFRIDDSFFHQALVLPADKPRNVQLIFDQADDGYRFRVASVGVHEDEQAPWILHADGKLSLVDDPQPFIAKGGAFAPEKVQSGKTEVTGQEFYDNFWSLGYHLTDTFRWIDHAWRTDGEVLGRMKAPANVNDAADYVLFPSLFDAFYQLATLALPKGGLNHFIDGKHIYVPWNNAQFQYYGPANGYDGDGSDFWCHIVCHDKADAVKQDQEVFRGDMALYAPDGTLVAEIKDWALKRVSSESLLKSIRQGSDWLYQLTYQRGRTPTGKPATNGRWLLLADEGGVAEQLAGRLEAADVVLVRAGTAFAEPAAAGGAYTVDPTSKDDFQTLLERAFGAKAPNGFVSLWALDAAAPSATNLETLATDEQRLCGGILHLGQALSAMKWSSMPGLWVVTRGTQFVGDQLNEFAPGAALLHGLGRVIALENPDVWRGFIDLDARGPHEKEIGDLAREILQYNEDDHVVLLRDSRHVAQLAEQRVPAPDGPPAFAKDGSYVITGGLGGLGLEFAGWLAEHGAGHIFLTSRRDPAPEAQQAIAAVEAKGAKVRVLKSDITDPAGAQQLIATVEKTAPVKGVIHAAGVLDDGIMVQQTWERFAKVLAPKVQGAWNLHLATRDRELDFFVLFSSVASLTGSPGQSNYAAGNSFMDGLAHLRRQQGLPGLSINWGPWAEVGMAANIGGEAQGRGWTAPGVGKIDLARGLELFGTLIASDATQAGVLPFRWPKLFEQFPLLAQQTMFARIARRHAKAAAADDGGKAEIAKKIEEAPAADRVKILRDFVKSQLGKVLGFDPSQNIDAQKGFFELGGDSLTSVELRNRLQNSVGKPLPTTMIFDYPSIEAISNFLARDIFGLEEDAGPAAGPGAEELAEMKKVEIAAEVDGMSDEEAEAELLKELAGLE